MFEDILNLIKENDSIVIFGHVNPDGDCYASSVSLREIILYNFPSKKVYISSSGVKRLFPLFGKTDNNVDEKTIRNSLGIIIDCRDLYRIEDSRYKESKCLCNIDHHISNEKNLPGPYVLNCEASSTSEILTDFVRESQLKINSKIATMLLLGIVSDTGRFQYANNYEKLFDTVSYLLSCGGQLKPIFDTLNVKDEKDIIIRGYIYTHYQKSEHGVIYIVFDDKTIKSLGITLNDVAGFTNTLSLIEGYPIWASFMEYPNHHMRAEFRSNEIPVQTIADRLGGGGHQFASGCCDLPEFNQKVIDEIVSEYDNEILKYRKCSTKKN